MKKRSLWLPLLFGLTACSGGPRTLGPDGLLALQAQGALVVDVRTQEEWRETGLIPGGLGLAYFDARGGSDQDGRLQRLKPLMKSPERPLILVRRSGSRGAEVGNMLLGEAGFARVYNLENGVRGWGLDRKPLGRCPPC